MSADNLATVTKMIEMLPDPMQERVVEHLREYIEDIRDDIAWNEQFKKTQEGLTRAAREARNQIAKGMSKPNKDFFS